MDVVFIYCDRCGGRGTKMAMRDKWKYIVVAFPSFQTSEAGFQEQMGIIDKELRHKSVFPSLFFEIYLNK